MLRAWLASRTAKKSFERNISAGTLAKCFLYPFRLALPFPIITDVSINVFWNTTKIARKTTLNGNMSSRSGDATCLAKVWSKATYTFRLSLFLFPMLLPTMP